MENPDSALTEEVRKLKEAEKVFRDSEERYRAIFMQSLYGNLIIDPETSVAIEFNNMACRQLGYIADEFARLRISDYEALERPEETEARIKKILLEGSDEFETKHRTKTGEIRDVAVSVQIVELSGNPYLYCIFQDITERKQAEEALSESEERFRAVSETAADAIICLKLPDKIIMWNRKAEEMFGYSEDDAIGKDMHLLIVPERHREKAYKGLRIFFETGEGPIVGKTIEIEGLRKDGTGFPVELSVSAMKIQGEWQATGIIRDISERKKAAEKLREEIEVTTHLLMISEAAANITDIDRLMKEVIHCVQKVLGSDICLIYAWDAEAKSFSPVQESGLPREAVPQFRTENLDAGIALIKRILSGKEPVVTARSVEDMMRVRISDEGVKAEEIALSWLPFGDTIAGISLTSKKNLLGLILAVFRQEKEFTDREFQVMQGMSNQASVSLEQARLYKEAIDKTLELSHKMETIKVMSQIDRSILSTLKADEVLETVTRLISKVISCDRVTVSLVDTEQGGFIYKAGFGTAVVPKGAFVSFADTSARITVETGRTECVNNLSEMTPLLPLEKRFLDEGFLSHIRVPITIKGDVAGILTVGAKRVAAFTKENLSTLEYLCSQIGVALSNARLITDLEELFIGVVKSLSSAIDAKSPWTAGHSERVTKYALDIAKQMGLSEKELKGLELTGLLHDVGKIGTYESILDKPARLNEEEQAVMRLHPVKGAEILAPIKQLKEIIPGVKYHHEFFDGTGYPDGLKGEAIPLHARILTVADTVDAMGADRPYREGRGKDVIIAELNRCSGTQFDPKVVEAFLKIVETQYLASLHKTAAS